MSRDSPDKGGVWSIHSTEVELWDMWTDIHCNYGHLLLDRIRDVFGPLHSTNRSRALGRVDRHWQKHNCRWSPIISCTFSLTPHLYITEIWLDLNQQPLNL